MAYKLAMLLGLTALLTVLMVDPADSACCRATKRKCSGWFWNHRDVAEEALGLLELLRGEQEDIAPEEGAMDGREFADTASEESALAGRGFGDHDTDQDMKLSKQEALGMLEALGEVDVANLPADWFESMDTNGNGFIDPEEYDEDEAKTHQYDVGKSTMGPRNDDGPTASWTSSRDCRSAA
uniref:EF-hand domain-containing protein n=1 Tax=Branchiostoma floridae TaxID=7739 RepID=C3YV00_BRAFL|eukprot:XP_002599851.1 hypothetical protein BRAFLDRAFT_95541 [Branchiostoma floridae]